MSDAKMLTVDTMGEVMLEACTQRERFEADSPEYQGDTLAAEALKACDHVAYNEAQAHEGDTP